MARKPKALTLILIILLQALLVLGPLMPIPPVEASDGDWLTSWTYRLNYSLTSENTEGLTNYAVLIEANTHSLISAGHMQPDGEDLIITDSDGTTQLKHWISEGLNTEETKIWVKVPTISASSSQDLYLYYGNANYQAPPTDVEWEYQLRTLEKAGSGWDDTGIRQIDAYYNESTGRLHVWYGGYDGTNWQVGYAYTDNLATEFTRGGNNPVIPLGSGGEFDDTHIRDASGVKIGNTFYIYYQSHDGVGWHGIGLAHVSDTDPSAVCTKDGEVLDISAGTYDSKMVASPAVCVDGSTVFCFYEAIDDSDKVSIAYATGSTGDPTSLTKQDQIKHANGSVIYNPWGDTMSLVPTTLIKVNEVWYMGFHYGRTSGVAGKIWRGWLKATTFPTNWEWCSENPMFRQGETEGWCINWHSSPEILRIGGTYYLYIERANEEFSEENGRIILYKGVAYGAGCDVFNVYNSFLLNGTTAEWTTYQCDINRTHDTRAKYGETSLWVNATVDNDAGYAKLDFGSQLENRSVVVWFYDDGTTWDNYWVRCDDGTTVAVIGVSADEYITHYAYRVGSTWYDTGTSRSAGWHKTEFVYRDGRVYMYLDDAELGDFADPDTFDLVYLSYSKNLTEEWYDKLIIRQYYDPEPTVSEVEPIPEVRIVNRDADNYVYVGEKYYHFQAEYAHPSDADSFDTVKIAFSDLYEAWALDLDGVDDYAEIPDDSTLDITRSLTIAFWFKTPITLTSQDNWAGFVFKHKGSESTHPYQVGVGNGEYIYFQLSNTSGYARLDTSSFTPTLDEWYHVACVFDDADNEMRIYVDGELNVTRTFLGTIITSDGNLRIGLGNSLINAFTGAIDEVRIYNRSLTATEIAYNKDRYTPYDKTNLMGWWHIDEGTGSSIYDSSGKGNTGTIADASWIQSNPLIDSHWAIASFDVVENIWSLESGDDIVEIETGTNYTSGNTLTAVFHLYFELGAFDANDVDIYVWWNDTSETESGWEIQAEDYFNIYNLGGTAEYSFTGASGQTVGGDIFELWAGGEYGADIYEDDFEYGDEGDKPVGWKLYEPNQPNNYVEISTVRFHSNSEKYRSLHIVDAGGYTTFAYHIIDEQTGVFYFTSWVYMETTSECLSIQVEDSLEPTTYTGPWVMFDDNGKIYYRCPPSPWNYFVMDYSADQWYNVTLAIDITSDTYDIYIDDTLKNSSCDFFYSQERIDTIEFDTYSGGVPTSETCDAYVDDIVIWRLSSSGFGGTAEATTIFRKLQHLHTQFAIGIPNGDDSIDDANEGYIEFGIDYYVNEAWVTDAWKVRINITDGKSDGANAWVKLNCSWYERGTFVKYDEFYAFWEGYDGDADYFRLWLDLWFNRVNASTTFGGRVNTYYFGVQDMSNPWFRWWTGANWGAMGQEITQSMFFRDLKDSDGNIFSCRQIELMRIKVKVWRSSSHDYRWVLRDFDHLDPKTTEGKMKGLSTPIFNPPMMPDMPTSGLGPMLWAALTSGADQIASWIERSIADATVGYALMGWSMFVNFLDNVAAFFGYPHAFSNFLTWITNGWTWMTTSFSYLIDLMTTIFSFVAVTLGDMTTLLTTILSGWINIITTFFDLMSDAYNTGFNFYTGFFQPFMPLLPVLALLYLFFRAMEDGVDKAVGDIKMVIDFFTFLIHLFISLVQLIIAILGRIIESIPVVE